jgi:hypothetical protein
MPHHNRLYIDGGLTLDNDKIIPFPAQVSRGTGGQGGFADTPGSFQNHGPLFILDALENIPQHLAPKK